MLLILILIFSGMISVSQSDKAKVVLQINICPLKSAKPTRVFVRWSLDCQQYFNEQSVKPNYRNNCSSQPSSENSKQKNLFKCLPRSGKISGRLVCGGNRTIQTEKRTSPMSSREEAQHCGTGSLSRLELVGWINLSAFIAGLFTTLFQIIFKQRIKLLSCFRSGARYNSSDTNHSGSCQRTGESERVENLSTIVNIEDCNDSEPVYYVLENPHNSDLCTCTSKFQLDQVGRNSVDSESVNANVPCQPYLDVDVINKLFDKPLQVESNPELSSPVDNTTSWRISPTSTLLHGAITPKRCSNLLTNT